MTTVTTGGGHGAWRQAAGFVHQFHDQAAVHVAMGVGLFGHHELGEVGARLLTDLGMAF